MGMLRGALAFGVMAVLVCGCQSDSGDMKGVGASTEKPKLMIRDGDKIKSLGQKVEATIAIELECSDASQVPQVATSIFEKNKASFGQFVSKPLKRVEGKNNLYRAEMTIQSPASKGKYEFRAEAMLNGTEEIIKSKTLEVEVK